MRQRGDNVTKAAAVVSKLTMHTGELAHSPAAGFAEPFEMLDACHERVARMLKLIVRLRAHLAKEGCDEQARQAAVDVMRYFDKAAPHHHKDEEIHVFPRLLAAGMHVAEVQRLQRDHVEMEAAWDRARKALQRVADGQWQGSSMHEEAALSSFVRMYEWHMAAEDELIFPAARSLVDDEARAAMGAEMARRRGVPT